MQIYEAFPLPIGISNIESIPTQEHQQLFDLEFYHKQDYDMVVTREKYVLSKYAPSVKSFIEICLYDYSQKTLGTKQKLRITQSWCTKHDSIKQYTFPHRHQNSIISGCYYVNADSNNEGIKFFKDDVYNENYITWETDPELMQMHKWNWKWTKFPVTTGMLVLFPSYTKHSVEGMLSDNVRCSLAFNTWFDSDIGIEEDFTRLPI
jgi:uncharacterized protein (TIGR02466 family)